ncbi:hypothetical protein M0R45_009296 [Rubus argutus]|uniref:Transmembrane protein n=1 Tax=Rubus argutus TaxID=59490 RepID=A0AAW1Y6M3_RUBAR
MAISSVTVLKSLFAVLGCVMVLTLVYAIFTDGLPFRMDILFPWMTTTVLDFYINVLALAAWVSYKESNWISATLWIILLACFGSITTCAYILLQLMKLSTKESEGPIYDVLLCHSNKYGVVNKQKHSPVLLIARVLFTALGFLMLGTMLYTMVTDGSPFRPEIFTPWMIALVVDFYINVAALSVWVAYKESSWITAVIWIIFFICLGSITTCLYIICQLWQLTSQDPVYLALFKSGDRLSGELTKLCG